MRWFDNKKITLKISTIKKMHKINEIKEVNTYHLQLPSPPVEFFHPRKDPVRPRQKK